MAISKIYGVNLLMLFLLNIIFFLIFMVVGGVDMSAGFFGTITSDLGGFFGAILTPGGTQGDVISSTIYFWVELYENHSTAITKNIVGLFWIWIPGIVSAFVAGRFFSKESAKNSFWGTTLAVMTLSLLTLIILFVPGLEIIAGNPIAEGAVAEIYQTSPLYYLSIWEQLMVTIFYAFLNGIVFGGIAAASPNVL